jgi:prepilin-type processing-associated H-X9-DG protein
VNHIKRFTLIEMLLVIAIIVILVAMLLPMMSRAKESGKRATCLSNQKQIGVALLVYASDHKRKLPETQATTQPGWGVWTIYKNDTYFGLGKLYDQGYLSAAKAYYCPSWECPPETGAAWKAQYGYLNETGTSGGLPFPGNPMPTNSTKIHYFYRASFSKLAGNWRPASLGRDDPKKALTAEFWTNTAATSTGIGLYIHRGEGYNVAYLDGHAKWVEDRPRQVAIANVTYVNNYSGAGGLNWWWNNFFGE